MLVLEFLLIAVAIAQVSKIVSEGYVFEWLRKRVARASTYLGEGITCQLCTGTWAGLLAALFAPEFIHIDQPVLAWLADGMALGFAGRLLYSVQETVLASSYWLERNNCQDEGPVYRAAPLFPPKTFTPEENAKMQGLSRYIETGLFGGSHIDVTREEPVKPITLDQIENMLDHGTPDPVEEEDALGQSLIETSRLIESEVVAPIYEATPQDWENDWRDLPDEAEELA